LRGAFASSPIWALIEIGISFMHIVPAILETSIPQVQDKLDIVAADGNFSTVQIDIADGPLVPTLTVTPLDLVGLDFASIQLDFHLMTEDPLDYVWEIAAQGQQLPVRAIFGQVERLSDQAAFLRAIRDRGWRSGLALDLDTPLDSIDDSSWAQLDEILLLAVPMGRQGQVFSPQIFAKIDELHQELAVRRLSAQIVIDGGIKPPLLARLAQAQVNTLVIGSFLWENDFTSQAAELS
jgi:pentose-5-phosphate-3-epimerase